MKLAARCGLRVLCVLLLVPQVMAAELLGKISDDTAVAATPVQAAPKDDRRIIYRVICSPEDKDLPDCDQSHEDNSSVSGVNIPMPDLPAEAENKPEQSPPRHELPAAPTKAARGKKHTKQKAVKKAGHKKRPR